MLHNGICSLPLAFPVWQASYCWLESFPLQSVSKLKLPIRKLKMWVQVFSFLKMGPPPASTRCRKFSIHKLENCLTLVKGAVKQPDQRLGRQLVCNRGEETHTLQTQAYIFIYIYRQKILAFILRTSITNTQLLYHPTGSSEGSRRAKNTAQRQERKGENQGIQIISSGRRWRPDPRRNQKEAQSREGSEDSATCLK